MFKNVSKLLSVGGIAAVCLSSVNAGEAVRDGKVEAELMLKDTVLKAGGESWVAVAVRADAGWHTYWKNPGDMGVSTTVEWKAPEGVTIGELQYPAPHMFTMSIVKSLGYEGTVTLLAKVNVADDFVAEGGTASISGKVSWLVCSDEQCVPGDVQVVEDFSVAAEQKAGAKAELIVKAMEALPKVVEGAKAEMTLDGDNVVFKIMGVADLAAAELYVSAESMLQTGEKPEWKQVGGDGKSWQAKVKKSPYLSALPKDAELVLRKSNGEEILVAAAAGK
ncbi:MAG: protein-disulfide reductase DsbD domain-containing protein [Akkermansiaceae bacterium]